MSSECNDSESCRIVALDRLEDAFVLYEGHRYLAAFYMAGYVIEVGIKSEFYRLFDVKFTDLPTLAPNIIKTLFSNSLSDKSKAIENIYRKNFDSKLKDVPDTLGKFVKFMSDFMDFSFDLISMKKESNSNNISSLKEASPLFLAILENRVMYNEKIDINGNKSTFHNTELFITMLAKLKHAIEPDKNNNKSTEEDVIKKFKLYINNEWSEKVRYEKNDDDLSQANIRQTEDNTNKQPINEEKAKEMLEKSISFIKDVLKMEQEAKEFTDRLNPDSNDLF